MINSLKITEYAQKLILAFHCFFIFHFTVYNYCNCKILFYWTKYSLYNSINDSWCTVFTVICLHRADLTQIFITIAITMARQYVYSYLTYTYLLTFHGPISISETCTILILTRSLKKSIFKFLNKKRRPKLWNKILKNPLFVSPRWR